MAVLGAVALDGAAAPATARTITIDVNARDYAFSLSRRSVPAGSTVRFVVRNSGSAVHDFVVTKRKRTRILRPRQRQTITVSFPRKGTFHFLCSVPGHARLGMKGAIGVSVKPPPTATAPASRRHVRRRCPHARRNLRASGARDGAARREGAPFRRRAARDRSHRSRRPSSCRIRFSTSASG